MKYYLILPLVFTSLTVPIISMYNGHQTMTFEKTHKQKESLYTRFMAGERMTLTSYTLYSMLSFYLPHHVLAQIVFYFPH